MSYLDNGSWTIEKRNNIPSKWQGKKIILLTRKQLTLLKSGTKLVSISGEEAVWNPEKPVDLDTRFGFTTWGLRA